MHRCCFLDMRLFTVHLYPNEMILLLELRHSNLKSHSCFLKFFLFCFGYQCIRYIVHYPCVQKVTHRHICPSTMAKHGTLSGFTLASKTCGLPNKINALCASAFRRKGSCRDPAIEQAFGTEKRVWFFWLGSWGVGNTATDGGCWGYCNLELLNTWTLVEVFVFFNFYVYFLFYYCIIF